MIRVCGKAGPRCANKGKERRGVGECERRWEMADGLARREQVRQSSLQCRQEDSTLAPFPILLFTTPRGPLQARQSLQTPSVPSFFPFRLTAHQPITPTPFRKTARQVHSQPCPVSAQYLLHIISNLLSPSFFSPLHSLRSSSNVHPAVPEQGPSRS